MYILWIHIYNVLLQFYLFWFFLFFDSIYFLLYFIIGELITRAIDVQ